jgi:hypothetical protein
MSDSSSGREPGFATTAVAAVAWTVLALAFAAFLFLSAGRADAEKENFYLIGGAIGLLIAAVNGYDTWRLFGRPKARSGAPESGGAPCRER